MRTPPLPTPSCHTVQVYSSAKSLAMARPPYPLMTLACPPLHAGHEVMPRSRPRGTPLTTTLPRGAPDCLAGLVFITTGTMETLTERELVDLVEGYGGEVRGLSKYPTKPHWDSCNYLIRGYNGKYASSLQQREPMLSDKVERAKQEQRDYEAGKRAQPLVILENEKAVFDLIVRKSGGAASAPAAAAAGSSARTQNAPPEHGIVKTELWSLTDFLQHVEGGGGGRAASSSSTANSVGCLEAKPKTLVVVHGLHPGYANARKSLYKETLELMQQVTATATATSTAFTFPPPPPPLPPSDLLLPPPASPTRILSDASLPPDLSLAVRAALVQQ